MKKSNNETYPHPIKNMVQDAMDNPNNEQSQFILNCMKTSSGATNLESVHAVEPHTENNMCPQKPTK